MLPIGDAVVTLDPYTGPTGPRIVARAATADSERNLLPPPDSPKLRMALTETASHHSKSARA